MIDLSETDVPDQCSDNAAIVKGAKHHCVSIVLEKDADAKVCGKPDDMTPQ
jgi:hypothetical protein